MDMTETATLLLVAAAIFGASAGAWSPAAAQSGRHTERDARGYRTGTIDVKPDGSRTHRDVRGFGTGTARMEGGDLVTRDAPGFRTERVEGPKR